MSVYEVAGVCSSTADCAVTTPAAAAAGMGLAAVMANAAMLCVALLAEEEHMMQR